MKQLIERLNQPDTLVTLRGNYKVTFPGVGGKKCNIIIRLEAKDEK